MRHLIISREYPPTSYPMGGIGSYVRHISQLLAEHGETVHVIGEQWKGASAETETLCDGRLIIHRVPMEPSGRPEDNDREARALFATCFPPQAFAWRAALLAERLVEEERIDCIEAQEWEAPLYYFLLRRSLGLGPARRPPCIVHLHSPTEFIVRHNAWDPGRPDYVLAQRLEEYAIKTADGRLCPSKFLARAAEERYELGEGGVHTIPLPIGGNAPLARTPRTWAGGSILYVGRLEPRKGVLEWVAAAVQVASRHPSLRFEFVGADLPYTERQSVKQTVEQMIPQALRANFIFHGEQPRAALPGFLAKARIAVVPSRWENFPNTCVEALCSGLPVLATRQGGMAEMVEDGRTGWLAATADPSGLADALERALATPPKTLAAMGRRASEAIHELCDNRRIVAAHVDFRRRLVESHAQRASEIRPVQPASRAAGRGVAVVVAAGSGDSYKACLAALASQTVPPVAVAVTGLPADTVIPPKVRQRLSAPILAVKDATGLSRHAAALQAMERKGVAPAAFLFLDQHDRPNPTLVEACQTTLERCPTVGVVSGWNSTADPMGFGPPPEFPYQLLRNEAATPVAVRANAMLAVGGMRATLAPGYDLWDLVNAVLAGGSTGVSYPAILADRDGHHENGLPDRSPAHWNGWTSVLSRTPEVVARHTRTLLVLLDSERERTRQRIHIVPREHTASPSVVMRLPWHQRLAALHEAARRPGKAAWRVIWLTKHAIYRQTRRWFGWPPVRL